MRASANVLLHTAQVDMSIIPRRLTGSHRHATHVVHEPSPNLQKGVGRLVRVGMVLVSYAADAIIGPEMPRALPTCVPLRRHIPCTVFHTSLVSIVLGDYTAT